MRLKELRLNKGISQNELGSIINVSGQTILNWENSIYEPNISQLIALANYFKVSVDYIINNQKSSEIYANEIRLQLKKLSYDELIEFICENIKK